jgi:hypothetical protein
VLVGPARAKLVQDIVAEIELRLAVHEWRRAATAPRVWPPTCLPPLPRGAASGGAGQGHAAAAGGGRGGGWA